jgi:hypothetical protein
MHLTLAVIVVMVELLAAMLGTLVLDDADLHHGQLDPVVAGLAIIR